MATLVLREKGTLLVFSKFFAGKFLWTHRLYCILSYSYIFLLDIEVPVNWRMLSPFSFPFFLFFLVLKRRKGDEVVFGIENRSFVCTLPTPRQIVRYKCT